MNELLDFQKFIQDEYDEDSINWFLEDSEGQIDPEDLTPEHLSALSPEQIDHLFSQLIELYMDVSGTDNIGDVYECLKGFVKDEKRIRRFLGEEDE